MDFKNYLVGKTLVSLPHSKDKNFHRTVVYICGHDEHGAIGLIVNKLVPSLSVGDLFSQLSISVSNKTPSKTPIYYGGSIEMGRGFVLHSPDYKHSQSIVVTENTVLTATVDVLNAISEGKGPKNFILALGYTGWEAGQLENDLKSNKWLCIEGGENVIFHMEYDNKWDHCIKSINKADSWIHQDGGKC